MKSNGFTLIELLIVIGIITSLAVLTLTMTGSTRRQAKDTQRKSSLKQFQTSLEGYANDNSGLYPGRTTVDASTILCTDLGQTNCPIDPQNGIDDYGFNYQSNGSTSDGTATATTYVLWAALENTDVTWVVCSNGQSGTLESVSVTAGACPL